MNWLRKALGLCRHKWQTVARFNITRSLTGTQAGILYVMQCEHCGQIQRKRVTP